jgi:predicted amidohydrolase
LRICAAQFEPDAGDVAANVRAHVALVELAGSQGAGLILFPEMSLTGYEPRRAAELSMRADDPRLAVFDHLANERGLAIAVGLPLRVDTGTQIAMIIFRAAMQRLVYAKRYLHPDEVPYFAPGDRATLLELGGHRLAPAICYESLAADHAEEVAALGADIYLASVAKSDAGIAKAFEHYPRIARSLRLTVVMANLVGPCDDYVAAGQSAVWNARGEQLVRLGRADEGLVMIDTIDRQARLVMPGCTAAP